MKARIREARIAAGMSQGQLARAVGCSRELVTQWENGATGAGGWEDRIAAATGCSPSWLRTGKAEEAVDLSAQPWAQRLTEEGRRAVQALVDRLPRRQGPPAS